MGEDPDYLGRSRACVGLLLDRGFGSGRLGAGLPGRRAGRWPRSSAAGRRAGPCSSCRWPRAGPPPRGSRSPCTAGGGRAARSSSSCPCLVLAVAWWAGRVRAVRVAGWRRAGGARASVLWGWLVRRGAAERRRADHRLRGRPATRSTGRGAPSCPTTAHRHSATGRCRRCGWSCWWRAGGAGGGPGRLPRLQPTRTDVTRMRALANEPMPTCRPSISSVRVPSGDAAVMVPDWPGDDRRLLEELEQAGGELQLLGDAGRR